jgi:hypothetical protein
MQIEADENLWLVSGHAIPDKYLNAWKARFEEHRKKPPDAEDERKFRAATFRDVVWKWRAALPAERQEASFDTIAGSISGCSVTDRQRRRPG